MVSPWQQARRYPDRSINQQRPSSDDGRMSRRARSGCPEVIEGERNEKIDRAQRDRLLGDLTIRMEELREKRRIEDERCRIGKGDRQPLDDPHTRAGCDCVSHGSVMRA